METRDNDNFTAHDFECKVQELLHIMLTMCENRLHAHVRHNSPVGDAMAEAALAVKASIRTFIFIERLPDEK